MSTPSHDRHAALRVRPSRRPASHGAPCAASHAGSRAGFHAAARTVARAAAVAAVAAAGAACGGGQGAEAPTAAGPALVVRELVLVGDAGDTLYTHRDHWHGFPVVRAGARARYTHYFADTQRSADDHDMPPRAAWFTLDAHPTVGVAATVEQPSTAAWEGDRLAGALVGRQAGASRVSLVLQRGTTTLKEAPPLPFTVR